MSNNLHESFNELDFERAVQTTQTREINFELDPGTRRSLGDSIATTHGLLLGEIHGVQENPSIVYSLMKQFGIKRLALE